MVTGIYTNLAAKSMVRLFKEQFKRLQRGRLRWIVALVASLQQSLKYRSIVVVYIDGDGDWHNCRHDGIFVSPELNVASYQAVRNSVIDLWCFEYFLQSGDVVIDVGAGIGDDALVFSKLVGENGCVIAIEAHPVTYRCLTKTIAQNQLKNVTALNLAVSDRDGFVTISNEDNFLSNKISVSEGATRILSERLDDVLRRVSKSQPNFVKMNIEGAETAALRGMCETLNLTPHVVISCHDFKAREIEDELMKTHNDVKKILIGAGYTLLSRAEDRRREVPYYVYGSKVIVR